MKQYKSLKDLPEAKSGSIFEPLKYNDEVYGFKLQDGITTQYPKQIVENNKDWFELIEPKEFTESQVNRAMNVYFDRCHRISPCKDKAILRNEIINELRK